MTYDKRIGWSLLVVALLAGGAWAQERVKPELMLVIASSRTMQLMPDGTTPQCLPENQHDDDDDAGPASGPNRLMMVKEVLAGSRPEGTHQWCLEDSPKDYPNITHYRAMCCKNAACDEYKPCGPDHGNDNGERDNSTLATAVGTDGLIYNNRDTIKFGLMTLDHQPDPRATRDGGYSYGIENFDVPDSAADHVGEGVVNFLVDDARGQNNPNLGVRNASPERLGPMLAGDYGYVNTAQPGLGQSFQRGNVVLGAVGETDARVRAHNALVMDRVRSVIAQGPASLSATLADLVRYYDTQAADDDGNACRRRFAILFTDGVQSEFYGGEECQNDGNCQARGACVATVSTASTGNNCPCPAGEVCVAGECRRSMNACVYERGWPYAVPEDYATELSDRGIPLFVVGFEGDRNQSVDELRSRSIAAAGSPGLGPDGADGFFPVSDGDDLAAALATILNETEKGTISRARPLIVAPALGDQEEDGRNLRQWRYTTFTEVPGVTDEARYGRVLAAEYGCPDNINPDDGTGLRFLADRRYDAVLQDAAASRRIVTQDPVSESIIGVTLATGQKFRTDGAAGAGADEDDLRDMARADAPKAGEDDPLRVAGRMLNGNFGRVGMPNGALGAAGPRQLGAVVTGDLVAITPPNIALATPAYLKHEATYRERPTMIAGGAGDGQVHIYRARDGFEIMTFVPRFGWQGIADGDSKSMIDGPLDVAEVAECRKLGGAGGDEACPDELDNVSFRTILVGGVGSAGSNIFGIDLTKADQAAEGGEIDMGTVFNDATARPYVWNVVDAQAAEYGHDGVVSEEAQTVVRGLGRSVSRPMLAHVVDEPGALGTGKVKAAATVGCGDDPDAGTANQDLVPAGANDPLPTGRCVLVLGARDGEIIRQFDYRDNADLNRPMVGSPVVYPSDGTATAEIGFIGDKVGRLWRIDMTERDPADWAMDIIWPPDNAADAEGYTLGSAIVDRPSVAVRDDGKLVIVFGTDKAGGRAFAVSLTHSTFIDENGVKTFKTERNWVFQLLTDEYFTGAPATRDEIVYFTTAAPGAGDDCVSAQGRLYGVHYTDRLDPAASRNGERISVVPSIPFFNDRGEREGYSLAILLPPGRIAYGQAIVTTPSCFSDVASTTDIVLNLADESGGATGQIQAGQLRAERLTNGSIVASPVGKSGVFTKAGTADLSICLDCDADGNSMGSGVSGKAAPFPSVVTYWGATFSQ